MLTKKIRAEDKYFVILDLGYRFRCNCSIGIVEYDLLEVIGRIKLIPLESFNVTFASISGDKAIASTIIILELDNTILAGKDSRLFTVSGRMTVRPPGRGAAPVAGLIR